MPLDYLRLMAMRDEDLPVRYDWKKSSLYALSVGMARDPLNAQELAYVFEKEGPKTLPSLATVISQVKALPDADCGWDAAKVLHGEQRLELFRPLPPAAELVISQRVVEAYDRGEKGALILTELEARLKDDGALLYRLGNSLVARGDGGFGGRSGSGPAPHALPAREPDRVFEVPTQPGQALFYRLLGDINPLHVDPQLAARAGFTRPILHGRCVFGIACFGVVAGACGYDGSRIRVFNARFTAVTFPGETLLVDQWINDSVISFRCRVKERNVVVLSNGYCELA